MAKKAERWPVRADHCRPVWAEPCYIVLQQENIIWDVCLEVGRSSQYVLITDNCVTFGERIIHWDQLGFKPKTI